MVPSLNHIIFSPELLYESAKKILSFNGPKDTHIPTLFIIFDFYLGRMQFSRIDEAHHDIPGTIGGRETFMLMCKTTRMH